MIRNMFRFFRISAASVLILLAPTTARISAAEPVSEARVEIRLRSPQTPPGTRIFISGNHVVWGDWFGEPAPMRTATNGWWAWEGSFPLGTELEYKFTLDDGTTAVKFKKGKISVNYRLKVVEINEVSHELDTWMRHVPAWRRRTLEPFSRFANGAINESSGIVRSRRHPGVYWTHNDSGDTARLFPIHMDGSCAAGLTNGIAIRGAENQDWEDLATGPDGAFYIGDVGNNENARTNLTVYRCAEPAALRDEPLQADDWMCIAYPDQDAFPPKHLNFDCEAMWWNEGLYFLTKHRSDTRAKLYRLADWTPGKTAVLEKRDEVDVFGMVTAADLSPDGARLAVLTYDAVWLFPFRPEDDPPLGRSRKWLPIQAEQCEALCFIDNDTLLITSEQGNLFQLPVSELTPFEGS